MPMRLVLAIGLLAAFLAMPISSVSGAGMTVSSQIRYVDIAGYSRGWEPGMPVYTYADRIDAPDFGVFSSDIQTPAYVTYGDICDASQYSTISALGLTATGSTTSYPDFESGAWTRATSSYEVKFTLAQSEQYLLTGSLSYRVWMYEYQPPSIELEGPGGTVISWIPPYNSSNPSAYAYEPNSASVGSFSSEGVLVAGEYTLKAVCDQTCWGGDSGGDSSFSVNFQLVPEPATVLLLLIGAAAALKRRKRRLA